MRLIDADNLKIPNDAPYKASVKRVVAQQPTVEAVPVVHGEWIRKDDTIVYWYECSKCGTRALRSIFGQYVLSKFCPRCGADMRKKV